MHYCISKGPRGNRWHTQIRITEGSLSKETIYTVGRGHGGRYSAEGW